MAVSYITKTAKDGSGGSFNKVLQDKLSDGSSIANVTSIRDSLGNDINPAKDESVQSLVSATGAAADLAYISGPGTIIALLKGLFVKLAGTLAISASALPLPTGAAQDGTDASSVTAPTGGAGIRGWLSGIYSKLSGTLAVSGTFWQATQPVSESYSNFNAPGPVTVGTSATLIVAARAGRKSVMIVNEGAVDVRVSSNASMTISNGLLLAGSKGAGETIDGGAAVYGIVASGTASVSFGEVY